MGINFSKQKSLAGHPKAVATKVGWVDPERGELLVSIRGLPGACDWDRKTNTFTKNGKKFDPLAKPKKTTTKKATKKVTKTAEPEAPKTEEPSKDETPAADNTPKED